MGFIMCMQIQEKILSLSIILSKLPNLAAVDVLAMIPGWAVCGGSNGYDLKIWRGFNRISRGVFRGCADWRDWGVEASIGGHATTKASNLPPYIQCNSCCKRMCFFLASALFTLFRVQLNLWMIKHARPVWELVLKCGDQLNLWMINWYSNVVTRRI